jgi:hypothetical protein
MHVLHEAKIDNISKEDISLCQKIKVPGSDTNILLVKMASESAKNSLYAQRSKLRLCKSKIFMNEDLTKEDATLFKKAREDRKKGKLYSVWSKHGLIWGKTSETGQAFLLSEK